MLNPTGVGDEIYFVSVAKVAITYRCRHHSRDALVNFEPMTNHDTPRGCMHLMLFSFQRAVTGRYNTIVIMTCCSFSSINGQLHSPTLHLSSQFPKQRIITTT
jgi:hypothetical protein